MKDKRILCNQGFTLIELIIAMGIAMVVMSAIFFTFKNQQDSYVVQTQVSATQQNIRAAMYMITRDLQMAGYLTGIANAYNMDWDNLGGPETSRPLIFTRDNVNDGVGGDNIKDDTDLIVIAMVSGVSRQLGQSIGGAFIPAVFRDIDLDGTPDLRTNNCALLVSADFNQADFFQVQENTGNMTLTTPLQGTYSPGDWLYQADVITYYVDNEDDGSAGDADDLIHPKLRRRNLSAGIGAVVVAEDIDNLQFQYYLSDGTTTSAPSAGQEGLIRAVEVSVLARTAKVIKGFTDTETYNIGGQAITPPSAEAGYRRRVLTSVIQTRNIGL